MAIAGAFRIGSSSVRRTLTDSPLSRPSGRLWLQGQLRPTRTTTGQIVMPRSFWQGVKSYPKRKPFQFAVMLNSVLAAGADFNTQLLQGDSDSINAKRIAMFFSFGIWQGATTYLTYCHVFSRLCPRAAVFSNLNWREKLRDRAGQLDVLKQVALDNMFYTPAWFFPSFYVFKANLQGEALPTLGDIKESVTAGLSEYEGSFKEDNLYSLALWVPADFVVFAVPTHLRMPVCACLNFGWTMFVSGLRGGEKSDNMDVIEPCMVQSTRSLSSLTERFSSLFPTPMQVSSIELSLGCQ